MTLEELEEAIGKHSLQCSELSPDGVAESVKLRICEMVGIPGQLHLYDHERKIHDFEPLYI